MTYSLLGVFGREVEDGSREAFASTKISSDHAGVAGPCMAACEDLSALLQRTGRGRSA